MVRQMEDLTTKPIQPAEEDPVIHGYLASLQPYSPSPGFEDRVMAHVLAPPPRWIRSARVRYHTVVDSGRVWWLLGGLTGAYAVALSIIVTLVALNSASVAAVTGDLLVAVGLPVWREALGVAAGVLRNTYTVVSTTTMSREFLLAAGATLTVVMAFNSWMLYRLMQPPQVVEAPQNVSR